MILEIIIDVDCCSGKFYYQSSTGLLVCSIIGDKDAGILANMLIATAPSKFDFIMLRK